MRKHKKNIIVSCLVFVMLLFGMTTLTLTTEPQKMTTPPLASAAVSSFTSIDDLIFTSFTNAAGESEYKVALVGTSRPATIMVIIPETHNGIPVTEIADNGFQSCAKLEKVILPNTIKKIGMNAFMNCAKLQRVTLPRVESIGSNAFGMCPSLERLYLPQTVTTVGATILRNNAKPIYLQSALTALGSGWSSTWSDYHTGKIIFDAPPEATIVYGEILDESDNVIGYELKESQYINAPDNDLVIYSTFSPDGESYKPVLNICPQAFTWSSAKSLTIRHRNASDTNIINIRSAAFDNAFIEDISIETDVSFNHPSNLQGSPFISINDFRTIQGDENDKSTEVFSESTVKSITLPSSLDFIPQRMFNKCYYLENLKIVGLEYSGENRLPNINIIGSEAFAGCVELENIFVPSSATNVGENIFSTWGNGLTPLIQSIFIDIYDDEIPEGWDSSWNAGINPSKVEITYKQPIIVTLNLQDGNGTTQQIQVKPNQPMPEHEMPERAGYAFKGFYSGINGTELQFYTDEMESARNWNEDNTPILYAYWTQKTFSVTLEDGLGGTTTIDAEIGKPMPATNKPEKTGYAFGGYYYIEDDGAHAFYYNSNMGSAHNWDKSANATLYAKWTPETVTVTFDTNKGNGSSTPTAVGAYTNPKFDAMFGTLPTTSRIGYSFNGWFTAASGGTKVTATTVADMIKVPNGISVTLYAQWSATPVTVSFDTNKGNGSSTPTAVGAYTNPKFDAMFGTLPTTTRTGYAFKGWFTSINGGTQVTSSTFANINSVPNGTSVTLYAQWTVETVSVTFNSNKGTGSTTPTVSGVYTNPKFDAKFGTLPTASRVGYDFKGWYTATSGGTQILSSTIADLSKAPNGKTVTLYAQWTALTYIVTLERNGGSGGSTSVTATFDSPMPTTTKPSRAGFTFQGYWDTLGESGGKQYYNKDMESTSVWELTKDATLYARWSRNEYTVILDRNGGSGGAASVLATFGQPMPYAIAPAVRTGFEFAGYWDTSAATGGKQYYTASMTSANNWDKTSTNSTLYARWTVTHSYELIIIFADWVPFSGLKDYSPITVTYARDTTFTAPEIFDGHKFSYWTCYNTASGTTAEITKGFCKNVWTYDRTIQININTFGNPTANNSRITVVAIYDYVAPDTCVAKGTLITLADGSLKPVELLTGGDMLLVWNHFTGKFDVSPIIFMDINPLQEYELIHLYFSDGTDIKISDEHAFWNFTLNRYVFIRDGEAEQYIGNWFNKMITDAYGNMTWIKVQLTDVVMEVEYTTVYSPVTFAHLNFYVNGLLSMPGDTEGLINIFEVDTDTMQYNQEAFLADIELYGLLDYADFADLIPEEIFEAFGVQYLSVSLGKGLITWEQIETLISQYTEYWN